MWDVRLISSSPHRQTDCSISCLLSSLSLGPAFFVIQKFLSGSGPMSVCVLFKGAAFLHAQVSCCYMLWHHWHWWIFVEEMAVILTMFWSPGKLIGTWVFWHRVQYLSFIFCSFAHLIQLYSNVSDICLISDISCRDLCKPTYFNAALF